MSGGLRCQEDRCRFKAMENNIQQFNGQWFPLFKGERWGFGFATREDAETRLKRLPCETCYDDRRLCDCGVV